MTGQSASQLFQVANWPRLPDDLSEPEHPEVGRFADQAREWMRQLSLILDQTLLAGGTKAAESSDALKNYPYPPGAVIYADAAGALAGEAGFTYDDANNWLYLNSQALKMSGPLTVEAASLINQDLTTDSATTAFKTITLGSGIGDGGVALTFAIERAWSFKQIGAGATTALALVCDAVNKAFCLDTSGPMYWRSADGLTTYMTQQLGSLALAGNCLPALASGGNLGSTALEWANLFIGTGRAYFGAAQNVSIYFDGTDGVLS